MAWSEVAAWAASLLDREAIQVVATAVTAVATVILGYATWVLAKETKVLSRATSQAHVTATLEPNAWAANYVDLIVSNSGNAVAYDIETHFDPPLLDGEEPAGHRRNMDIPLRHISILRPTQTMQSNLAEFAKVSKKSYRVTVSWKHHPAAKRREALSYELSMMDYHDVSYLGARSPLTQMAEQIKKLREDWQHVARGRKRIKADIFTERDRAEAQAALEARYREMMEEPPRDS